MKKVGFIGAYDKADLIMYVAKTLIWLGKKVMVADTTILQKMKYIVPSISPTRAYVTSFEDIDFAVGFKGIKDIQNYLGIEEESQLDYDYMLVDIDKKEEIDSFEVQNFDNNYFVTGFDMYSLNKGVSILQELTETLKLTKILYVNNMSKENEEYLNYLTVNTKTTWNDYLIYFPKLEIDNQAIEENQKAQKIRIKKLSNDYQEGIFYIAKDILKEKNIGALKKMIRE